MCFCVCVNQSWRLCVRLMVFRRKDLWEARAKPEMSSEFQMRCISLVEASGGQQKYYVRSSWHSEECNWEFSAQSDIPSGRGIWWPRTILCKVSLTFTVMHKVSLTFWGCRHTPSRYIWWPRAVLLKIILTFWRMQLRIQCTVRHTLE